MTGKLTRQAASEALPGWRLLLQRLHLSVRAPDAATAFEFIARVGRLSADLGSSPDLDMRGNLVHVALSTRPGGGVTDSDVAGGRAVDAVVEEMGLSPDPTALTVLEIAIDAIDIEAVRPFWEAVLGWDTIAVNDLQDRDRMGPAVWFQQMDEPRPQRNRIHIDVTVPHDQASDRIERALEAGGRLVSAERAPAFWILADPEGNEACVCTWQGRDPGPAG